VLVFVMANAVQFAVLQQYSSQLCSISLFQCLSPAYLPLLCMAGECGLVTFGNDLQCPLPCRVNTQCSTCLATPRCGWCALGSLNGRGLCMEGGPGGPIAGICSNTNVVLFNDSLSGESCVTCCFLFVFLCIKLNFCW
jgi:hypothetical protein